MDNLSPELLSVILGLITPVIVSWLKNPGWSRQLKQGVAVVVSAAIAVVSLLVTGELVFDNNFWAHAGASLGIVISSATVFYNMYFRETTANKNLEETSVL